MEWLTLVDPKSQRLERELLAGHRIGDLASATQSGDLDPIAPDALAITPDLPATAKATQDTIELCEHPALNETSYPGTKPNSARTAM